MYGTISIPTPGLECLCSVLKCMVEWSREYYTDPATTGLNAVYRPSSGDTPEEHPTNESRDLLRPSRSGSTVNRTSDSGQAEQKCGREIDGCIG